LAVFALFLLNGVGIASWAAHVPYIKGKFALSEAVLGVALLAVAAGSVSALLFGGQLVARLGSRLVTIGGAFGFCAALPLLLIVPTFPLLFPVLMFFGACIGAMEVALNVQAIGVEERYGRPIMSSFHALFSVGGLLGASVAGVALSRGISPVAHMVAIAFCLVVLTAVAMSRLLLADPPQSDDAPAIALPTGPLLGLGILAFFCLVAEGAMADWSAVYLRESLGTDPGYAAAGYAAFSVAMAAGRFGGDALRARLHAVPLVRLSGALAAAGLGVALVIGEPLATLVGFACVGLGLSNVVPVLFTAAGRTPGVAMGTGIAAVASFGYFGFLLGPPVIGFVAQLTTLTWGLGVLVVLLALIALLAGGAARADAGTSDE
jgi:predicted MFS family arabinose efflux permease